MPNDSQRAKMEELFVAFQQSWPDLSTAIKNYQFKEGSKPAPLLRNIAATNDSQEKIMFCGLLDCFDSNFSALKLQSSTQAAKILELDSNLTHAQNQQAKMSSNLSLGQQEIASLNQTIVHRNKQVETQLTDIGTLNSKISKLNVLRSSDIDKLAQLTDQVCNLQSENNELKARNSNLQSTTTIQTAPASSSIPSMPRRSRSDPEPFTGNQQDTEKRQAAYERWKTQVEQVLIVDSTCFPDNFTRISFITSQLSGRAWSSVQDGVQAMNSHPRSPEQWFWASSSALWEILDRRYILLDSTQSAKNKLDTLFQEKRAYGDFKVDFDHLTTKAKYDDRSKVDLLRKHLNKAITSVIDNQVILPSDEDYKGWSKMTDNIARNLKQQEHIASLRQPYITSKFESYIAQPPAEIEDPMELDRIKLSYGERRYRPENNLCIACGEKGHFARGHHR